LFNAAYANVQPLGGANANIAMYFALLAPGDTVLGMDLSHGGHLTHGSPVNFSGKLYHFVAYGVDRESERLDYDQVAAIAARERPKMITVGASAYSRAIDYARFRQIADSVGAFLFADIAHPAGLIARGLLPSPLPHCHVITSTTHKTLRGTRGGLILLGQDSENPFGQTAAKSGRTLMMSELLDKMVVPGIQGGPLMHAVAAKAVGFGENLQPEFGEYAAQVIRNAQTLSAALVARGYHVISGGTDNHLMLVDISARGITGKEAEQTLDQAGITVNKNTIPFDTRGPMVASGIRIGTPAVTTRGMNEPEMEQIAALIDRALTNRENELALMEVRRDVRELCRQFPL